MIPTMAYTVRTGTCIAHSSASTVNSWYDFCSRESSRTAKGKEPLAMTLVHFAPIEAPHN